MYKKGNAAPSLHPDSAANMCRTCAGTCFSANFPPITAWARIGSVGVTQAAMTSDERKLCPGSNPQIKRAVIIHPHIITGASRMSSVRQCRQTYA